jgi:hypothetical protein
VSVADKLQPSDPVRETRKVQFLEWTYHIEALDQISGFESQEKQEAKQALLYLQRVLGDDFLRRSSVDEPFVARHPLLRTLANFAPSSRRALTRLAYQLRILETSQNFCNVVARLHDVTQFDHDALVIKVASRLAAEGLQARFEPTMEVKNNQKQADLRLEDPVTRETVFVEVTTQGASQREREITDTNTAVLTAVFGTSYDACLSGRWESIPSKQALGRILKKIDDAKTRAISERTVVTVQEDGILEMALCHRDQANLLALWSVERDLSGNGLIGPTITCNDTVRIKRKIRDEQVQLPEEMANVLVILTPDVFFRAGGLRRVAREVEEGVFKRDHVHLVILHGEYMGGPEGPSACEVGEHRYTRRIVDGFAEHDLVLVNRHSQRKLSDSLFSKFLRSF